MSRYSGKSNTKQNISKSKSKAKRKGSVNEEAVMKEQEVKKKGLDNDPNWYMTDPVVANQATQLSFNHFLGSPESKIQDYVVPTVAAIMLNPSCGNTYPGADGISAGRTSGFNMAITKLYNRLSMKSGRNMAYAPQDVGTMYLAQGELVSMITYVRRAFAVAQTYNQRNRMFPKAIIKAMGFDPDDFFENFSNYRMRFNTLLASVNQIPILTESGYMRKCNAIYGGLYLDSDNSMAQIYMYVPYSTWIIDEALDQRGSVLVTTPVCAPEGNNTYGKVWKFFEFMDQIMEPMVSALLSSSTLNLVYADMLNLAKYETMSFASFEAVKDEDTIIPQYDLMVLKQIHNMVCMGAPVASDNAAQWTKSNNVYHDPDNNCVVYSPLFKCPLPGKFDEQGGSEIIVDTDNSDPDIAERIEITRFSATYSNTWHDDGSGHYNIHASIPDHYGVCWIIYGNDVDATAFQLFTFYHNDLPGTALPWLSQFDWHPILLCETVPAGQNDNRILAVFADLGFFTTINSWWMRRLNQIIYMSLFEIRG